MAKLTYDDKIQMNENVNIPAVNKGRAVDWNEIKTVVNTNDIVGSITMYGGSTVPSGYLLCDGQAVSRTTYSDLFDVIGTTYGAGDGSTTFNVPNLKGKIPVGLDSSDTDFDTLGEIGGSKYLQEHTHDVWYQNFRLRANRDASNTSTGNTRAVCFDTNATSGTTEVKAQSSGTGNSGNLQPYIVLNYIIHY